MTISSQTQADLMSIRETLDQRIHEIGHEAIHQRELEGLQALRKDVECMLEDC